MSQSTNQSITYQSMNQSSNYLVVLFHGSSTRALVIQDTCSGLVGCTKHAVELSTA